MKFTYARLVAVIVVATAVVVGCQSLSDSGGGTSPRSTGETVTGGLTSQTSTDFSNAGGFFTNGANDVPGGTPVFVTPDVPDAEEGEETASHFRAIQIDPTQEDTAGPKFVRQTDLNGDGLIDLVSGWNQSQPVQIHLQQRDAEGNISFQTASLGGTWPVGIIAGIEVADMDGDGSLDVVVLVKHTGAQAFCLNGSFDDTGSTGVIIILFGPAPGGDLTDGDAWDLVLLWDSHSGVNSRYGVAPGSGDRAIDFPEDGGYTSLSVGDIDGVNGPDIVATSNVPPPACNTGENVVELWLNPGANVRDGSPQNITTNALPPLTTPPTFWYPLWLDVDAPLVKDSLIADVDNDGDLDVLSAYSNSITQNIRWYRNPAVEQGSAAVSAGSTYFNKNRALFASAWEARPVGTVDGDVGTMTLGDMDGDGFEDLMVRAADRRAVVWFRHPAGDQLEPIFPPPDAVPGSRAPWFNFPWQVYALVEYPTRAPMGIGIGDLTADGQVEAVVAVGGAVEWFDSAAAPDGIYSEWGGTFVIDDTKAQGTTADPTDPDFVDTNTLINEVLVVDLDDDGYSDFIATLDRRVNSSLTEDSLIWFRNTLGDAAATAAKSGE